MTAPEGAHESFAMRERSAAAVEKVWREFWLPSITELVDGKPVVSIEKLKGELYDCHHLIIEAPKVYRHVTGGLCDDTCASADGIIAQAEEQVRKRVDHAVNRYASNVTRPA